MRQVHFPLSLKHIAIEVMYGSSSREPIIFPLTEHSVTRSQEQFSLIWYIVFPFSLKPVAIWVQLIPISGFLAIYKFSEVFGTLSMVNFWAFALHLVLVEIALVGEMVDVVNELTFSLFELFSEVAGVGHCTVGGD